MNPHFDDNIGPFRMPSLRERAAKAAEAATRVFFDMRELLGMVEKAHVKSKEASHE